MLKINLLLKNFEEEIKMALKDWKKGRGTGDITFRKGKYWINIDKHKNYWSVESNLKNHIWRDFKIKSQALRYAKSYMRSH